MFLKDKTLVWICLKRDENEFGKTYLNFRGIIFIIHPLNERAFWVEVLFPYIWQDMVESTQWLAYDRDYAEWYESIESAEYAVETYLSNVLWFIFEENEKDNRRCSEKVS
jgi:hypothetical protein